ncbi:MAG: radical SAM protein, partial [Desulfatiglandales bacterium]
MNRQEQKSPEYVRISRASALSIGLISGWMYKSAVNRCVNLLLQYPEGCFANCAYCGLARHRPFKYEDKSFIHVDWPVFHLDLIIDGINKAPGYVKRSCISMITHKRAFEDTCVILERLKAHTKLPVSVLVSPTVLMDGNIERLKGFGADKIGVAIDLANQVLFDQYRGKGVKGPHRWERYWKTFEDALLIFGYKNVGIHLMV